MKPTQSTRGSAPTPRRTTYAVAIESRAKAIQEALGVQHYDACLDRIGQIRDYCDDLETEIRRERDANPQHVARWGGEESQLPAAVAAAEKAARRAHDLAFTAGAPFWTRWSLGRAQSILMHYVVKEARSRG